MQEHTKARQNVCHLPGRVMIVRRKGRQAIVFRPAHATEAVNLALTHRVIDANSLEKKQRVVCYVDD
jgi:hypothetical protein